MFQKRAAIVPTSANIDSRTRKRYYLCNSRNRINGIRFRYTKSRVRLMKVLNMIVKKISNRVFGFD